MDRTRVLVVDDCPDMRSSLKQLLELLGYEVETARNGVAALTLQRARSAGVVLTDIFMPDMDGLETIAKLKAGWPTVRVVAMSGGGEVARSSYLETAVQIGADATLQKPFTVRTLLAVLGLN